MNANYKAPEIDVIALGVNDIITESDATNLYLLPEDSFL